MKNSALYGSNAVFIEELYRQFLRNPQSVDESWYAFFAEFDKVSPDEAVTSAPWQNDKHNVINNQLSAAPKQQVQTIDTGLAARSLIAMQVVIAYRQFGHTAIQYDPLKLKPTKPVLELSPEYYGLNEAALDLEVELNGIMAVNRISFRGLFDLLKGVYARSIGCEFSHIEEQSERKWLQDYVENATSNIAIEERKAALLDLMSAEMFEEFLHKKFPGAKRFSLEGGEAMIASLNATIGRIAQHDGQEIVLGMAHRGRLNVLTRVMGKPYVSMFSEFRGESSFPADLKIPGDVKYHLGASTDKIFADKKIHLSLLPNPSHLELVNAVALGKVRAKQDMVQDTDRSKVVGILIHGDAAFSGQGSVPEALSLSQLNAYSTGGTIHVVINNQIGFTTNPTDSRGTRYCTEVAKVIGAPVMHINGEDIDTILFASKLAADYRNKFKKDIVLDIICYRKYGHNEGDEPFFTQPAMYNAIAKHVSPRSKYASILLTDGVMDDKEYQSYQDEFHNKLEIEFKSSETYLPAKADWLEGEWSQMQPYTSKGVTAETGVPVKLLKDLLAKLCSTPTGFNVNSKIARQLQAKLNIIQNNTAMDWGTGEALAMATLLHDGYNVRLSGQDCQRGTFSHRHAVLTDQESEQTYCSLQNLGFKSSFEVYNSNLSELAVMGFEYGYSITTPKTMTMWEGQFGDFANGAQMIIDQYVCSGEAKWLRMSGLVLLLPHGYEGQGPEHSSARLERFLQLCADDNMQVVNCTTPASFFHVLRRQMHRKFRKPLVVMTPKSLLRHKLAVSTLADLAEGTSFAPLLTESQKMVDSEVRKVVLCSGKIFYDLWEKREELKVNDVALLRLEQLYPFPKAEVLAELKKYSNAQVLWCQEEQKNMGAYSFVRPLIEELSKELIYVGRGESASPATGYMKTHLVEQKAILDAVFSE